MDRSKQASFWFRLALPLLFLLLFGLSPRPQRLELTFQQVEQARRVGDLAAEAGALATLAHDLPWQAELWEQAGRAALNAGLVDEATAYLEQALSAGALSVEGHILLGDAYLFMGQADQAVSTWQTLIGSLENPAAGLYLRLANQQRLLGDVTAAINTLRTLLEHHPATAAAAHELALLLAATNPEAALPYLEQASTLDPNLDEQLAELKQVINTARFEEQPAYTLLASGRALGNLDEWNLANLAFQQATELRADYAEAWAYLGYAQERLGKDGGSALQKALGLDPQSLAANLFFAMHFTQTDNPAMALIYLHNAARIKPNMAEIQLEIGNVLVSLGDLPGAQRHYERALSLAGTDANIWRTTAELATLYNIEVRDLALPAARQALLLAPKDAAALDTLGRVYFVLGDPLSARRFFLRALQQDPGYAPAHLHLGMVLILQGDKLAAQDRFRLVLTLVPDTSLAEQAKRLLAGEAP